MFIVCLFSLEWPESVLVLSTPSRYTLGLGNRGIQLADRSNCILAYQSPGSPGADDRNVPLGYHPDIIPHSSKMTPRHLTRALRLPRWAFVAVVVIACCYLRQVPDGGWSDHLSFLYLTSIHSLTHSLLFPIFDPFSKALLAIHAWPPVSHS